MNSYNRQNLLLLIFWTPPSTTLVSNAKLVFVVSIMPIPGVSQTRAKVSPPLIFISLAWYETSARPGKLRTKLETPRMRNSGIEPEAGLEPATLRLSCFKSHTLYRLSYPGSFHICKFEYNPSQHNNWKNWAKLSNPKSIIGCLSRCELQALLDRFGLSSPFRFPAFL